MRKSLIEAKRAVQKALDKSGYTRLKNSGIKSKRPSFPDLRIGEGHRERYPSVGGFAQALPPQKPLPPDAKAFPVATPHKQGPMLALPGDAEWAGGKKP